ncbi:MAG: D-alanine--D-alanine ligase [Verrucomicrobiales bacterium]|jgi:D-alanine-D-alanine ligase|nr:D-alanine--D-alanine ligase [Verrucomicrobiales bacterium]
MNLKDKNILLLKGGISAEREVSLRSSAAIAAALRSLQYQVTELDVTSKDFVIPQRADIVFIGLHGVYGEDGELQERLEDEGHVFTGSGSEASWNAFEKLTSKKLFLQNNVRVAAGGVWNPDEPLIVPCVLKPVADGSSVGLSIVRNEADVPAAVEASLKVGKPMLVEEFITGREVTVGILGDTALPVLEIAVKGENYDYQHKYTAGLSAHICPAEFDPLTTKKIQDAALAAYRALGCTVYSRVDIIVTANGEPVVLEVNTLPGMTDLSLLPDAARAAGIGFPELCEKILTLSVEARR